MTAAYIEFLLLVEFQNDIKSCEGNCENDTVNRMNECCSLLLNAKYKFDLDTLTRVSPIESILCVD